MRAATLAVGTEVTDGQILDANSKWISSALVSQGIQIVEHRAVPDDRQMMTAALEELCARCDLLFVTGGLGPTSDDFTREVIAQFLNSPLKFHEGSWQQLNDKLQTRGVAATESQKRQCYFPANSKILVNDYGTANGFQVVRRSGADEIKIFALPGPPIEIEAIFNAHLAKDLSALIPLDEREQLRIWRCLGKAESDLADLVEQVWQGLPVRLGYRAHSPYVEIKVWTKLSGDPSTIDAKCIELEHAIAPWLVNRDHEDVFASLISRLNSEQCEILIYDAATKGQLEKRIGEHQGAQSAIRVLTDHTLPNTEWLAESGRAELDMVEDHGLVSGFSARSLLASVSVGEDGNGWNLQLRVFPGGESSLKTRRAWHTQTIQPIFKFPLRSDRGRKFITEKLAIKFNELLGAWKSGQLESTPILGGGYLADDRELVRPQGGDEFESHVPAEALKSKSKFPHSRKFKIGGHEFDVQDVIRAFGEDLSDERRGRIDHVLTGRTCNVVTVLEDIYDRGNASAVMRSCEAMGFQVVHMIESGEKFKRANRVSSGADKWLDVVRWRSTLPCVQHLKAQGYQIVATHLDAKARPLSEIDFSKPTAFVLGNEKEGISQEMIDAADFTTIIPMSGFVQSFNISVAGALGLFHIRSERETLFGRKSGDLTLEEQDILRAVFMLRSTKNAAKRMQVWRERNT